MRINIPEIWSSAEMAVKLCRVIWYLRTDPMYTRKQAADELEFFMRSYVAPKFVTVFDTDIGDEQEDIDEEQV